MKLREKVIVVLVVFSYTMNCVAETKPVCIKWTWTKDTVTCLKWKV